VKILIEKDEKVNGTRGQRNRKLVHQKRKKKKSCASKTSHKTGLRIPIPPHHQKYFLNVSEYKEK
jgi:hypothetical protein